jgi:hypothetical protein
MEFAVQLQLAYAIPGACYSASVFEAAFRPIGLDLKSIVQKLNVMGERSDE